MRDKVGRVGVPLALEGEEGLLEPVVVDRPAADDPSGVVGEEVGEAGGEEVDRAMTHANVGELGLVEVDIRGRKQGAKLLLKPFWGDWLRHRD